MPSSALFLIGLLSIIITLTECEVSHMNPGQYKAAVVEYYPFKYPPGTPADVILMENVKRYSAFIKEIENLDIIVFPESTLTTAAVLKSRLDMLNYSTNVPNPSESVDVCDSKGKYPPFLTYLACTAQKTKTYIVVNLIEQKRCNTKSYYGEFRHCSKDGWNFYNTNVVFDRKGRVVARYRKYHLFGEFWMNRTVNPDIAIFKTDFGVKFGIFTCFDIIFKSPPITLVKNAITNIIYPSMWFSELPFLTALQTQMQWAYEMNAVLLSAGANNCERGSGGSGIFQGRAGPIVIDYPPNGVSKAYIATLPTRVSDETNSFYSEEDIDEMARKMDGFYLMKENLTEYTLLQFDPMDKIINTVLCSKKDGSICCYFYVRTKLSIEREVGKQHYNYFMVAHNGIRSFKNIASGGVQVCGIIACTSNISTSCGKRFPNYDDISWPITFTAISISANFSSQDRNVQFPNTLLSSIRPVPVDSFEWKYKFYERNSIIERTLDLRKVQNRLLTFAIYGRDFRKDSNLIT